VYDARVRSRALGLGWICVVLLCVCTTAPALRDPPYWDANVYVAEGRWAAAHGVSVAAWRQFPDVLKPPVFAAFALGVAAAIDHTALAMHLFVLAFALVLLGGVRSLVRALGGDERQALIAGLLTATAPLFVAQAGLVLSDLPMTALATWAWVALVRGRTAAWLALSALAVLTKESAYFLCAPALVLEWLRAGRATAATARRALVFAWPGLVLAAWLGALHVLTGHAVPRLNRDALGANFLLDTLIHQLVEGGRILLVALAVVALRARSLDELRDAAVWATAAGVLALPLMFPAPLPRYMLPGLPLLAALAALGAWRLAARPRAFVVGAIAVAQVGGWFGASWHANGGHHLDCNLRYRTLVATQQAAVRAIVAARPRAVVAAFPMWFALRDAGVPLVPASGATPTADLCAAELFVESDQSAPTDDAAARVHLVPWQTFGAPGLSVKVSRIDCAAASSPRTPPAPPPSTG
jgi:4-amino-4-deoxy-L-arabinose transferase-like glycosyltransferase